MPLYVTLAIYSEQGDATAAGLLKGQSHINYWLSLGVIQDVMEPVSFVSKVLGALMLLCRLLVLGFGVLVGFDCAHSGVGVVSWSGNIFVEVQSLLAGGATAQRQL